MTTEGETDLLGEQRAPVEGLADAMHGRELVADRFPAKPYCLVEQWTIFQADLTADELKRVSATGHMPLFVFAHCVVEDSQGRFREGDWVRSSMCVSFENGMFETTNTVYVLIGPGGQQTASLKTIFSFF